MDGADGEAGFRIAFTSTSGTLRAVITGFNDSLETTLACWTDIIAQVQSRASKALLVIDRTAGDPPPPRQLEQFVDTISGQGLESIRIAYVLAETDVVSKVEVAEIHGKEAGFDVRVFASETDAIIWLHYGIA